MAGAATARIAAALQWSRGATGLPVLEPYRRGRRSVAPSVPSWRRARSAGKSPCWVACRDRCYVGEGCQGGGAIQTCPSIVRQSMIALLSEPELKLEGGTSRSLLNAGEGRLRW